MTGLDGAFRRAGAADWGGVAYERLTPFMTEGERARAASLCPGGSTVLVAAFPYYAGDRPGNLSLYARGADYHKVLRERLNTVCGYLAEKYPGELFLPGSDSSPLPERAAARLAGLGIIGRHGLVILPPYGSWVFLGTVFTTAALPLPERPPAPLCQNCGRCVSACPAGALGPEGVEEGRCLSCLTQKKGALTPEEAAQIAGHPYVWGCDLCQRACPHNSGCACSPLPEFRENLIDRLYPEDLAGLSGRAFRARYGDRAFAWRGPAVLRRNLALQSGLPAPEE